jgi:hypothetical protein
MKHLLILIAFTTLLTSTINSQEKDVFFEQITNESGRSLGFITGIAQDEPGFMWFSTRKGLYRYNGYSYKLFKHKAADTTSLPFNDITFMYRDNKNQLWIRHYDQFSVFANEKRNSQYDSVLNQHFDIEAKVVQDKDGNYWIGPTGNGLLQFNPEKNITKLYQCPPKSYSQTAFRLIDSLIVTKPNIASISKPHNNIDTTVNFKISVPGYYLVYCTGEMDKYGMYDFGAVYRNQQKIWATSMNTSVWAGGEVKNRVEASVINLRPDNIVSNTNLTCRIAARHGTVRYPTKLTNAEYLLCPFQIAIPSWCNRP